MFLNKLIRRNPEFINMVFTLHQKGSLPANSYILDLDTMARNAALMANEGDQLGLKVYPMTKQIGRNPPALDTLSQEGLDAFVAVDMQCALPIHAHGYKIGHLGHLVQVPKHETDTAAAMRPSYWTVFNKEKAQEAAAAANKIGYKQALLSRIFAEGDTFYMGHEGGFPAEDILEAAQFLDNLKGGYFAGITTFPALLFDPATQDALLTPNMATLEKAAEQLSKAGRSEVEINAPGTTSMAVMRRLANAGATQVEPGHGLTGTTPLHAVKDLPESPAILYLSEVSHIHLGKPYCFGGGLYIDPVFPDYDVKALVGKESGTAKPLSVKIPPANAIDYYGIITDEESDCVKVGDTVVFGFRPQAFVTRAYVTPLSGICSGNPKVKGVFTSDGREAHWPNW
jgi:predicted amino acid racemase